MSRLGIFMNFCIVIFVLFFGFFFGGEGERFLRMLLSPAIHNIFAFSFLVFIPFMPYYVG